jgi:peptidoglycan hydrolase-like protein with peptidoglycan-binding domain
MRLNLCPLAAIAVMTVSCITYAQSSGTAFVVAPGLLVTNHHVIDGCGAIEVVAADGRRPATVVDSVQQIDLALLRVYGLRGGVASLRTKSATLLGESATVFGFPLGGALSSTGNFTTGVVSSLRGLRDAAGEIQITAPVQPGNSGGPVLDRSGLVIGVVQSKLDALKAVRATGDIPQNVNFAVSLDVLADFLAKHNVQFNSVERQPALETTQVAEIAQSFTYKISCTTASRTATAPKPQTPSPAAPAPDKLVQDIQTALNQKGFNAGPADGFIGPQTQTAITSAQRALGLAANGIPSSLFLSRLRESTVSAPKTGSLSANLSVIDLMVYANEGNAEAQFRVGNVYFMGFGMPPNKPEGIRYFRLAAAQGHILARFQLGSLYETGVGVEQSYSEAARWYRLAASQGYKPAQKSLDLLISQGLAKP